MADISPDDFIVNLRSDRRCRLTPEQVFRLWKCALKDDDKLVDAAIEKLYEEMIAFNPARAESVIRMIIDRDDAAETIFRGLLRDRRLAINMVVTFLGVPPRARPRRSIWRRSGHKI